MGVPVVPNHTPDADYAASPGAVYYRKRDAETTADANASPEPSNAAASHGA